MWVHDYVCECAYTGATGKLLRRSYMLVPLAVSPKNVSLFIVLYFILSGVELSSLLFGEATPMPCANQTSIHHLLHH